MYHARRRNTSRTLISRALIMVFVGRGFSRDILRPNQLGLQPLKLQGLKALFSGHPNCRT